MNTQLSKVIVALDCANVEQAYRVVDEIGDQIAWYKVGSVLYTRAGNSIIDFLHKRSKRIFLDLKLHDIPNVVANTLCQVGELGVHFATVHCLGGRRMLQAASLACRGSQLKLLGITLLTSHEVKDSGVPGLGPTDEETLRLVELALESRLAGVLCSPHEAALVRKRALPGFLLVTPGIRLPNHEVFQDDQVRVASPQQALAWGADFLVIGRPIFLAREPGEVVKHLFDG